ncbi:cytochrome P450 2D3-like [Patella vulgata]|uniref:cytochrome P450 2D3-like n=1 Tax=Patella vulgata TaxID=6465 RepID=UPI00217F816B|nr:cytochrome P450 2D3-like [Patella vulgata]
MIPFLGNILQLEIDPRKQFAKFRRRYGDLFSLYIGNKHIVVLNGFETLQDLLVKSGDKLSNRPDTKTMEMVGGYKGIISTSGKVWREQRMVSLALLQRFISEDGKLIPREELIPFSMGKRKCMAETTAKMETFLFFSHMIQKFRFITEPGKPAPGFEPAFGVTSAPKAYKICAIPR